MRRCASHRHRHSHIESCTYGCTCMHSHIESCTYGCTCMHSICIVDPRLRPRVHPAVLAPPRVVCLHSFVKHVALPTARHASRLDHKVRLCYEGSGNRACACVRACVHTHTHTHTHTHMQRCAHQFSLCAPHRQLSVSDVAWSSRTTAM
jgi:hypothetical protein